VHLYRVVLGMVCLHRVGQCACKGYTGDGVFVQVILRTVWLYRKGRGVCL